MNIVTIGGGTGHYTLLRALRLIDNLSITAVVSVADSGGSSGVLRDQLGVLPPGDFLKVMLALSEIDPDYVREFLLHRFEQGPFKGHTIGNLLIAKHAECTSFMSALHAMREMLVVRHEVLPVSLEHVQIHADLPDGTVLEGEGVIDVYKGPAQIGGNIRLVPEAHALPAVTYALHHASVIVIAPGSLHTSLLPVIKVEGVAHALRSSGAKLMFVCNTMSHAGDTHGLCPHKMVVILEDAIGRQCDHILVNDGEVPHNIRARYEAEKSFPFICGSHCPHDSRFVARQLLACGELARHDYVRLGNELEALFPFESPHEGISFGHIL